MERSKIQLLIAEVEAVFAKGEAEMKSWKAEVDVQGRKKFRLWTLSLLTFMALSFVSGQTLRAEEIGLWHQNVSGDWVTLKTELSSDQVNDARDLLGSDQAPKADDLKEFVHDNSSEPAQFLVLVAKAKLTALHQGNKDFGPKLIEGLTKLDAKTWKAEGSDSSSKDVKDAYLKLVKKVLGEKDKKGFSRHQLEDKALASKLLKDKDAQKAFGLKDKNPADKSEANNEGKDDGKKKTDKPKTTDKTDALAKQLDEFSKAINERLNDKIDGLAKQIKEAKTPPATGVQPTQPVAQPQPTVGEQNNTGVSPESCALYDALRRQREKDKQDGLARITALENQLRANREALDAVSKNSPAVSQLANKPQQQGLEDLVPQLLQNALGNDQNQNRNFAQQPIIPQGNQNTAPVAPPDTSAPFGQMPPPNQQMPPNQYSMPMMMGPMASTGINNPISSTPLYDPSAEAARIAGVASGAQDQIVSPALLQGQDRFGLAVSKGKLQAAKDEYSTERENAEAQAQELQRQLKIYEKDAYRALDPGTKQHLAELKSAYTQANDSSQQMRQMMMMMGNNPQMRDSYTSMMMQTQMQANSAKAAYEQYNQAVQQKIQENNGDIEGGRETLMSLNKSIAALRKGEKSAQGQIDSVEGLQQQQLQMEQMRMQQAMQAQQPSNRIPNIRDALGGAGNSGNGGPRTMGPSQLPQGPGFPQRMNLAAPAAAGAGM